MAGRKKKKRKNKLLDKPHSRKAGLPPGSLIYVGDEEAASSTKLSLIQYNQDDYIEHKGNKEKELLEKLDNTHVNWLNTEGLSDPALIQHIGNQFQLHPLVTEDILNSEHRPKAESFDKYLFFTFKALHSIDRDEISYEQMSFVLTGNTVLSFQEKQGDLFDEIRKRLDAKQAKARKKNADYLFYRLIDIVVDNYFIILESLGEQIEELENEVYTNPTKESLHKIQNIKRELIYIRKAVYPLREAISKIVKDDSDLLSDQIQHYFTDVYDHCIYVIDTVETYRDLASGMMDMYMTSLSNKMNEVMKVLTIIATIFIPLTFIVGVYGMNFEHMPELQHKWAYPAVWVIMIIVAGAMLLYFKRKKWL